MGDHAKARTRRGDAEPSPPRRPLFAGKAGDPLSDDEVARLESVVEAGSAAEVRAAARTLLAQLRLRTFLHRSLVKAIRTLDAQDCAGGTRPPMEGP